MSSIRSRISDRISSRDCRIDGRRSAWPGDHRGNRFRTSTRVEGRCAWVYKRRARTLLDSVGIRAVDGNRGPFSVGYIDGAIRRNGVCSLGCRVGGGIASNSRRIRIEAAAIRNRDVKRLTRSIDRGCTRVSVSLGTFQTLRLWAIQRNGKCARVIDRHEETAYSSRLGRADNRGSTNREERSGGRNRLTAFTSGCGSAVSGSSWSRISHDGSRLARVSAYRDVIRRGKLARSIRYRYGRRGSVVVYIRIHHVGGAAGHGSRVRNNGAFCDSSDLVGGNKRSSRATCKTGDGANCRTSIANIWTAAIENWSRKLIEGLKSGVCRNVIRDLDRRCVAWTVIGHLQREDGLTSRRRSFGNRTLRNCKISGRISLVDNSESRHCLDRPTERLKKYYSPIAEARRRSESKRGA